MIEPISPITKQQQLHNRRRKRRIAYLTRITPKVREEVLRRVEEKYGHPRVCERCERTDAYTYEMAHLTNASQLGRGDVPWNVALLCGPSTNTGTCHNFVDYTREGREWKKQYQEKLKSYYGVLER